MRRAISLAASLCLALQTFAPAMAAESSPPLNFKIYSPAESPTADNAANDSSETSKPAESGSSTTWSDSSADKKESAETGTAAPSATDSAAATESPSSEASTKTDSGESGSPKVLQGYIRVVPSGTKIPIIMDSAVDSDTSQEGDEFAARTGEDLLIDGSTVVPAGSVIKGRIAQLNAPRALNRSGSVALKFDTVTTPDNRQIPIVANLVARGGVVHAKRGLKDIAMDTGTFALPTALGIGIGALAGGANNGSSSIGRGGGALIGAAVGAGIGIIILCAKKGKKIDVRPGDELKIELAEDLRMPM